jgi:SAM-dependent methyltransferase
MATTIELDPGTSYERIAPHYDSFTDHPGHMDWFARLEALARSHGLTGHNALDVGCGTGKSTLALIELGYDVIGCEPCEQMLALAKQRLGDRVTLVRAPAQELPYLGRFDYISCVGDICNYILDPTALRTAFAAMAANLAEDGILLFDINTPVTYLDHFAATVYSESPAGKLVWSGFDATRFAPNGIVEGTLELFEPEGDLWRHRAVRHAQRHYDVDTIDALLAEAELRVEALYGQTDAGPPEQPVEPERHTKAVYLAKHSRR